MSLLTQAHLLEQYGPRVNLEQLASLLQIARGTIYNQISAGRFPIPTFIAGKARFADYRDVAEYLDSCRARAKDGEEIPA